MGWRSSGWGLNGACAQQLRTMFRDDVGADAGWARARRGIIPTLYPCRRSNSAAIRDLRGRGHHEVAIVSHSLGAGWSMLISRDRRFGITAWFPSVGWSIFADAARTVLMSLPKGRSRVLATKFACRDAPSRSRGVAYRNRPLFALAPMH